MVKSFFRSFYFGVIFALFISACALNNSTINVEQKTSTPVLPEVTVVPSAASLDPKILCHTPICMSSVPAPTIAPAMQARFFDLLKNNGNCELPCFLGITPGKTTWIEAEGLLEDFSASKPIQYDQTRSTSTNRTYSVQVQTKQTQDISISMHMGLALDVDQNNLVQHIVIRVELYGDDLSEFKDKHLLRYGLREVFERNGPPDMIYFGFKPGDYNFDVVYDRQKIVITFSGNAKQNTTNGFTVCPNMGDGDVSSMEIALANPSDSIDVKTLIGYPFYDDPLLEESTELSSKDFYHLIVGDQQPACFQVK